MICLFGVNYSFGQSTFANNLWTAPRFLGYNTTNGINPLFFRTNDLNRMKINGIVNYGINGYAASAKNGYMLIGESNNSISNNATNIYTGTAGAFSLLHLNGPVIGGINQYQEYGYRPWMQTGVSFTGNR